MPPVLADGRAATQVRRSPQGDLPESDLQPAAFQQFGVGALLRGPAASRTALRPLRAMVDRAITVRPAITSSSVSWTAAAVSEHNAAGSMIGPPAQGAGQRR